DDLSNLQKIKKLSDFFPQGDFSFEDRLKEILKRDYSKLEPWTVSRAVELLGKLHKSKGSDTSMSGAIDYKDLKLWIRSNIEDLLSKIRKSEMPDEIFLCLYHTDEIVYSAAAKIIYNENPLKCADYLTNMSPEKQLLYQQLKNDQPLLLEKIKLLKKYPLFNNLPENLLAKIAKHTRVRRLNKNEEINLTENEEDIYLVMKGTLGVKEALADELYFFPNEMVMKGLNLDQGAKALIAKKESLIMVINRYEYFGTLMRETEIIPLILDENNRAMRPEEAAGSKGREKAKDKEQTEDKEPADE
ncbi:MAG: hypothetical protein MJZ61_08910, partial [Bacteroidales bacterium]|nr:hypothetical protein [Bacteroidales bacterium]